MLLLINSHIDGKVGGVDSHRADVVTGQAVEAGVHLLDQVVADFQVTFQTLSRQRYPAARRSRLTQGLAISRADRQAQPAADAMQILFFSRLVQGTYHGSVKIRSLRGAVWNAALLYAENPDDPFVHLFVV